jgi:hypothetical protein
MCQATYNDEMAQTHAEVSSPETNDIPQRSRNARAQARHRAKRKAYIEKVAISHSSGKSYANTRIVARE